jgi:hypothetical protein
MKKTLGRLSLILLCCSISALLAFRLIESRVDSKGVLREPFFLLPISILRLVRESPRNWISYLASSPAAELITGFPRWPGGGIPALHQAISNSDCYWAPQPDS